MRSAARAASVLSAAVLVVGIVPGFGAGEAPRTAVAQEAASVLGSQGTNTALPPTDSQVTVHGRGPFADLAITVNQTRNLTDQAVSITWSGGIPTTGPGSFGSDFLQIMQCWGDDDGTVAGNPGPPPEQCVAGAATGASGVLPGGAFPSGLASTRVITQADWPSYEELAPSGVFDDRTGRVWRPFRAVNGAVVGVHINPEFSPSAGGEYWLNPFFDIVKTNEIGGAATRADGRGAEIFKVDTGVESSGLGCGQRVQPVPDGEPRVPQCWIVIVPRGSELVENAGVPPALATAQGVVTSPLAPAAWKNRIAIPIEFNPVDSPCTLGADERRMAGNEMALGAVASWQPALCGAGELPPYAYAPTGDNSARQQIASPAAGSPGMVVVSRAIDPARFGPDDPVVYAPIVASSLTIAFNIERFPLSSVEGREGFMGIRVAELNLTPRLVAKLLTQSYRAQVTIGGVAPDYEWLLGNPNHLGFDPDFLRFNPEFALLLGTNPRTLSGLQLPIGNSDAARQMWGWILADPEARAWLDGEPDEWGMRVNPIYSTDPAVNPSGTAFGEPLPTSFPKDEPYCYEEPTLPTGIEPPALCGPDWMPYARSFAEAAQVTRTSATGARIELNPSPATTSDVWKREPPQRIGSRSILAVTDTASATRLGLQMARLSRAGDTGDDRVFVAPTDAAVSAAIEAMTPGAVPAVLEPDPTSVPDGAYPLAMLSYAAIAPLRLDDAARADYAAFLRYASDPGQRSGHLLGQLPPGYVPLPAALRAQTVAAAAAVVEMEPLPEVTTTTSTTSTTTTTTTTTTVSSTGTEAPPPGGSGQQTSSGSSSGTPPRPAPGTQPDAATGDDDGTTTTGVTLAPAPADGSPIASTTTTTRPPVLTPSQSTGNSRFAIPGVAGMALGASLVALEITKRPRRRDLDDPAGEDEAAWPAGATRGGT